MSEEELKAFLEKVKGDTSLQEKLKAAADSDAVLAIAKDAGFSISADDLTMAQSELSDEKLEGVAGGWVAFLQLWTELTVQPTAVLTNSTGSLECPPSSLAICEN